MHFQHLLLNTYLYFEFAYKDWQISHSTLIFIILHTVILSRFFAHVIYLVIVSNWLNPHKFRIRWKQQTTFCTLHRFISNLTIDHQSYVKSPHLYKIFCSTRSNLKISKNPFCKPEYEKSKSFHNHNFQLIENQKRKSSKTNTKISQN